MSTTLLFVSSNPSDTSRLDVDEEYRAIDEENARQHRSLDLRPMLAARVEDLRKGILDHSPAIVHFAGHGQGKPGPRDSGRARDVDTPGESTPDSNVSGVGLVVKALDGSSAVLPASAIGELFRLVRDQVRLVVLNACHTDTFADVVAPYVECIVGTGAAIGDAAAIEFARGFYAAIGRGYSVSYAVEWGRYELRSKKLSGAELIQLRHRAGVGVNAPFLHATPGTPMARPTARSPSSNLARLLAALAISETYLGRSQLLSGLHVNLNRSEANKLLDLQQIITQLQTRRTADGAPCLARVIENALSFATGTDEEAALQAERAALGHE